MQSQTEAKLHRQRHIDSEDRMVDQGTIGEMIKRVMDQPRNMRSQYTIMHGEVVYQPDQIQSLAQEFGLADAADVPIVDDGTDAFATKS
jgi:hypothetical protein